jgi:mannose-6-phosphate isomerase-like protein (cupin superfamily)
MSDKYRRSKGAPHHTADAGYEMQTLYNGESAIVIGSTVRAGGHAPPHHMHEHSDQLYFVIRGEMKIQLGSEVLTAGTGSLVYIPRGTPHHNWNESDKDEFHYEVLSPAPLITQPVVTRTDATEAAPGYFVRQLADVEASGALPGFSMRRMLQRSDGSENMALYVAQVDPGGAGPSTHIHAFDQFYYVLEGELTVEVALDRFTAGPDDLVVLPAGVPHRQWNAGSVPERHLTLLVSEPEPGEPWDVAVKFGASDAPT